MNSSEIGRMIEAGGAFMGIELGSTRIKAVLVGGGGCRPLAGGSHEWENKLENGVWTYHLADVWAGMQACFRDLTADVQERYGVRLKNVGAMGVSAMMHGYLAFDAAGRQLAPFRTWRNTMTGPASAMLTELFGFNIPQRWSIAHLYQSILNEEAHVKDIAYLTTLAGYVHWKLTGEFVTGIGDASGMFPIDSAAKDYHVGMLAQFEGLVAGKGYPWKISDILPRVLVASAAASEPAPAGRLTGEGAKLLDPSGALRPGVLFCPPEGDAGTGMVATNSVARRTGNVSAGTSIFAMVVLERPLQRVHEELDMVTTPTGSPVAMVHCNNGTSDLDAWVRLLGEAAEAATGMSPEKSALYGALYGKALEGEADGGGLVACNYLSGEHTTGFTEGRPLLARLPDARFTLANFMRAHLYAAMATLKMGMDILTEEEGVRLDLLLGHGGLFKTKDVAQQLMANALNVPVAVMESAAEGGAWGIALLAAYSRQGEGETLEAYLQNRVFAGVGGARLAPNEAERSGFLAYMRRYAAGLAIERAAVEYLQSNT